MDETNIFFPLFLQDNIDSSKIDFFVKLAMLEILYTSVLKFNQCQQATDATTKLFGRNNAFKLGVQIYLKSATYRV